MRNWIWSPRMHLRKSQAWWVTFACKPSAREVETGGSLGPTAVYSTWQVPGHWEILFKRKIKGGQHIRNNTQGSSLASICKCTYIAPMITQTCEYIHKCYLCKVHVKPIQDQWDSSVSKRYFLPSDASLMTSVKALKKIKSRREESTPQSWSLRFTHMLCDTPSAPLHNHTYR